MPRQLKPLLLVLMLLPFAVVAQQTQESEPEEMRLNSLKLYPFAFVKSRFAISYERALQNRWSVQLGLGIVSNDNSTYYNGNNIFGYSADLQFRKYLQPDQAPLSGIYFAPHIGYKTISFDTYDYYYGPWPGPESFQYRSSAINGGLVMGYQFHILKVVAADVYAGGGYRHTNPNRDFHTSAGFLDARPVREYNSRGVYPIMGLQIGVLF